MVLEHSPIAFPQPRTKPKVDLGPTRFNHILELYLSRGGFTSQYLSGTMMSVITKATSGSQKIFRTKKTGTFALI